MTTTCYINRERIRREIMRDKYLSCDRCQDWSRHASSQHGYCVRGGQLSDCTWSHSYCGKFKHKRLTAKEISDRVEEAADNGIIREVTIMLKQDRKDTSGYIKIVYK